MDKLSLFLDYAMLGAGGGERLIPFRYIVNTMKGLTPIFILSLMWYYQNFSIGAFLYLSLHGSYGIMWIVKDLVFGDKNFAAKMTIPSGILAVIFLMIYWSIGWVQLSGYGLDNPTNERIIVALLFYIFGVNLMLVSDAQKFFTLKYRKGLVDDGMFYATRNPNYLGEIMLYGSFAILTANTYCYIVLISIWVTLFYSNMLTKDKSLKKKEGWEQYQRRSWMLLPKLYSSDKISIGFYSVLGVFLLFDYSVGGQIEYMLKLAK